MITNCLEAVPESFGELRANPSVNSGQGILRVSTVHQLTKRLEGTSRLYHNASRKPSYRAFETRPETLSLRPQAPASSCKTPRRQTPTESQISRGA